MPDNLARMIYLHALTPVHSGTGQAVGVIDLPIAREKVTNWPMIPASSLKGVLRDVAETRWGWDKKQIDEGFGKTDEAGTLCFGDLRILCFPVRSFFGTFAYVTCPLALTRFLRDGDAAGVAEPFTSQIGQFDEMQIDVTAASCLMNAGRVYLEDLDLNVRATDGAADAVAARIGGALFSEGPEMHAFSRRFAIVSDNVFNFLCETATDVSARVKLDDNSKTVARGGLWYEEAVPAEAIFYTPVVVANPRKVGAAELLGQLASTHVQIGGKASVGRGLCGVTVRP